jgi:hypothetical protein
LFDRGEPQRRLADPGFALQHENLRPRNQAIKKLRDRVELPVPAGNTGVLASRWRR